MEIGTLLVIVAGILAILDVALGRTWSPDRYARARWLMPVALLLVIAGLLVGVAPIVNT